MLLCSVKLCDISPLVVMVTEGAIYRIKLINDCSKPCFCNVVKQNFQFDLLKAFSSSVFLLMKNGLNLHVLLDAFLPLMKPV